MTTTTTTSRMTAQEIDNNMKEFKVTASDSVLNELTGNYDFTISTACGLQVKHSMSKELYEQNAKQLMLDWVENIVRTWAEHGPAEDVEACRVAGV